MRERAAELGGTCIIDGTPGAGTRVLARLPVQRR
jgi:signal transduction histidine kinase